MADNIEAERYDPTRLVGRWTVAGLALAGAALVLLPSTQFGWESFRGGWAARPTLWIGDLTALIGLGLALAILWSRETHRAAPLLGAALGASAIAWGLQSADAALAATGDAARWLHAARSGAWILGSAMLSAFCTRFPRRHTREDREALQRRFAAGHVGSGLAVRDDPFAVMDAPLQAWDRWIERRLGMSFQQRIRLWEQRLGLRAGDGEQPAWMRRFNRALEPWLFHDAWLLMLALLPVVVAVERWGPPKSALIPFAVTAMIGVVSCIAMRYTIMNASIEERRRVLWIAAGMVGAIMIIQLCFWSFIIGGFLGYQMAGIGLFILSAPLGALVLVLGFAIAIFGGGALDPGLAIKRTLVSGIVATLLTFMFAMVEGLVATLLADQLGLPASAAPAIASAVVAVALGPMWKRVSGWVGGRFGVSVARHDPA